MFSPWTCSQPRADGCGAAGWLTVQLRLYVRPYDDFSAEFDHGLVHAVIITVACGLSEFSDRGPVLKVIFSTSESQLSPVFSRN